MKVVIIIIALAILAIFAFGEAQQNRKLNRKNNRPDFEPMKLDEDKINDQSNF